MHAVHNVPRLYINQSTICTVCEICTFQQGVVCQICAYMDIWMHGRGVTCFVHMWCVQYVPIWGQMCTYGCICMHGRGVTCFVHMGAICGDLVHMVVYAHRCTLCIIRSMCGASAYMHGCMDAWMCT